MSGFVKPPPKNWNFVQAWKGPSNCARPLYYRHTPAGTQWIYAENGIYEFKMRGWTGAIHRNPSLVACATYADSFSAASNMRICSFSPAEFIEKAKIMVTKALQGLARGTLSELETGRECIGVLEAMMRELRGRMVETDDKESTASRAERMGAYLYRLTFDVFAHLHSGTHEEAFDAIEAARDVLDELEDEAELLRDKYKSLKEAMS